MLRAVRRGMGVLDFEARVFRAGVMQAKLAVDIKYAIFSMSLSEHHYSFPQRSNSIVSCSAIYSMLLAVRRRLAALNVEDRLFRAGVMQAKPAVDTKHDILSISLSVRHFLASLGDQARSFRAGIV